MEKFINYYDSYHKRRLSEGRRDLSNFSVNLQLIDIATRDGILPSGSKVLEIGCGSGLMLQELENRSFETTGIDISRLPLTQTNTLAMNSHRIQADGVALPFADSTFDCVFSFDSLEHVTNSQDFLHEVHRVTNTNGSLVFRTPNKYLSIPWEIFKGKSLTEQRTFHPQLQTLGNLQGQLTKSGYNCVYYKLPISETTTKNKLEEKLGTFSLIAKLFPWAVLPLALYPVFYGIATKK